MCRIRSSSSLSSLVGKFIVISFFDAIAAESASVSMTVGINSSLGGWSAIAAAAAAAADDDWEKHLVEELELELELELVLELALHRE